LILIPKSVHLEILGIGPFQSPDTILLWLVLALSVKTRFSAFAGNDVNT